MIIVNVFTGPSQRLNQVEVIANPLGQPEQRMVGEEKGNTSRLAQRFFAL
jgi:hypothetical protein